MTIYCTCCQEMLWSVEMLEGGRRLYVPLGVDIPPFRTSLKQCPFCEQELELDHDYLVKGADGHFTTISESVA